MLSYLHACAAAGIVVNGYTDPDGNRVGLVSR
jgi:hypothetical protein